VSTLTVILSLPWRACTKAARTGAPLGPFTVPVMLAAAAGDAANESATQAAATQDTNADDTNATPNRPDTRDRAPATQADDRMAFPRVSSM
jgi:hypothetical protein